jgi:hypothetical protein
MEFNLDESLDAYEAGLLTPKAEIELFAYLIQFKVTPTQHYADKSIGYINVGAIDIDGNILWDFKGD